MDSLNKYRESKKQNKEQLEVNEQYKEEMKEEILNVEIAEHELAKKRYDEAKEEWDSKGAFYRFFHRKQKPRMIDYEREVQEEIRNGRGL